MADGADVIGAVFVGGATAVLGTWRGNKQGGPVLEYKITVLIIGTSDSLNKEKVISVWTCVLAVGTWEVGVGAGRFCRTSSGGGTGKTTGEALEGSLLTNKTSMGPDVLLRRIWYFRCPLRTCTHSRRHERNNNRTRERRGKSTTDVTYRFWYGHL